MTSRAIVVAVLGVIVGAASAGAQPALEPARTLYAAADYEGALAALAEARVPPGNDMSLAADRLTAFCLMALDRGEEADAVIARIVTTRPDYDPGDEVSPRLRIAFRAVRDRLVPALARRLYDEGRAAFDRGAYVAAVERFTRALPAIEALAMDGQREMEDLRVLTSGFLSLARDRVPPPATPRLASRAWPVEAVTPAPGPANADLDAQTTPPIAIEQDLPSWVPDQYGVGAGMNSAIDVRIDETGRVVDVTLVSSAHPRYDFELMRAARSWRYEPARRAGLPVASQKRVEVVRRAR